MQNPSDDALAPEKVDPHKLQSVDGTFVNLVETQVGVPKAETTETDRGACLVQIYPTDVGVGQRHLIGEQPLVIGRDKDCDIRIDDPSVSRRHAQIKPGIAGCYVIDLRSTNGTFVNDKPASMSKLKDGDYIRIGNWILRYLTGGNVESQYHEEIYRLTIIDGLTGIHNKRYFLEFLGRELSRVARYGRTVSLVMFDIDHFKAINDKMGHLAGDYALRELTACVRGAVRMEELFARYGGEEFAIVLPETPLAGAMKMAERVRRLIEEHTFQFEDKSFAVTISMGVATNEATKMKCEELIGLADEKLYEAKNSGRNRVVG